MDEPELRKLTVEWIKLKFKNYTFVIEPILFHDLHITLKKYILKKFKGVELTEIPNYDKLTIAPDVVALVRLPEGKKTKLGWVIVECKAKPVVIYNDFREFTDQANIANALEAYLVYAEDHLSSQVIDALKTNFLFMGMNRFGCSVKKSIQIYEYNNGLYKKVA